MEKINFEITKDDVKNYLKRHENDQNIKYKEALFVQYIKNQKKLTKEAMEILMWKYNDEFVSPVEINSSSCNIFHEVPSFDSYLNNIKNLDISGICHILIPSFGYYEYMDPCYSCLEKIPSKLLGTTDQKQNDYLVGAINDYYLLGKVDKVMFSDILLAIDIKMSRKMCEMELQTYSLIYGEDSVKKIKNLVKELV